MWYVMSVPPPFPRVTAIHRSRSFVKIAFLLPFAPTAIAAAIFLCASSALAQPDPSGIDFVTIGAVGNPAYSGPDPNHRVTGRGGINYLYKLGRTEVTTSQWMEFFNTFYGRVNYIGEPDTWGAIATGNASQPFRLNPSIPQAGDIPVSGIIWRASAMYCNWLHNDKSTDIEALQNGAYDISTFGYTGPGGNIFTDQAAHNPDARYWIPTLDEWIKASYYDPNYGGAGVGGWWWRSINGSNTPIVNGPPGQGQANAGFDLPGNGQYRIPLGAYPDTLTPWGLLDAAGGTAEFLETIANPTEVPTRYVAGTAWSTPNISSGLIYSLGGEFPSIPDYQIGFRVAAAIPAPATAWMAYPALYWWGRNTRKSTLCR